MPWVVSSRMRQREAPSYGGAAMTNRMSVILSPDGFEFVFICPEMDSRSAWLMLLPAAIADVAAVLVVRNALLETPQALRITYDSFLSVVIFPGPRRGSPPSQKSQSPSY